MTTVPCINTRLQIEHNGIAYNLDVTARTMDSLPPEAHTEIIVRTVKLWLYIAKTIQAGETRLPESLAYRSVEMSLEGEAGFEGFVFEHFGETRCTVFDWNNQLSMTLHSNSLPQPALDLWLAMREAKAKLAALYKVSESAPQILPARSTPSNSASARTAPAASQDGVIVATRAPNPNNPSYADGQLVSFTVNRIVMGTNTGSVTYALWGPLGAKYPLKTIYKTKSGSDENSADYIAAKDTIVALGLSVDAGKIEAAGNWQLVCKATHATKDGATKEYANVVSLTAI